MLESTELALGSCRAGARLPFGGVSRLLLLCLAGCSGDAFLIGESTALGDLNLGGGRPQTEPEDRCADTAELRLLDSACWPTRHVGRWRGFVTTSPYYHHRLAAPFEFPSGELLLEINAQGVGTVSFSASTSGSARPGDAGSSPAGRAVDASVDAGIAPNAGDAGGVGDAGAERAGSDAGAGSDPEVAADAGAALDAAVPASLPALGLALGFRYQLQQLAMSGGPIGSRQADPRLDFMLLIAEPWSELCASLSRELGPEIGPCLCPPDGCGPDLELLSVTLSLSADAQALRGTARSLGPDGVITAGWELVRE